MNTNNRKIVIIDDLPPEAIAMVQALYSRDPKSVTEHLETIKRIGPEKFMAQYYVGYGHKSIGDCGTTTVFVEQVSMLNAKAIQDWPLYNGQEASTRYLDMSGQEILNPLGTAEGKTIQDGWMKIYGETLEGLIPFIKEKFPCKEGESEKSWNKAVKAKAFDIARGFLPAGATTLLSWHTNLRQAYDKIQTLKHHPLTEVREVAEMIHTDLKAKYPSSFSHKIYPEQEEYLEMAERELTYFDVIYTGEFAYSSSLQIDKLMRYKNVLTKRPVKTELSNRLRKFGNMDFEFALDFGSFRDLQRQRSGSRMMPLLTTKHGFFPWYIDQLPDELKSNVEDVILKQEKRIAALDCSPEERQYYIAMGYTVACDETYSLPAAVYVAELRSGQTVHPTLRVIAQKMGRAIAETVPGIALHCDMNADEWNIKRGTQDIVKKADLIAA